MEVTNIEDYSWVDLEYLETPFSYAQKAKVVAARIKVGSPSDWVISLIPTNKWVCRRFKGCSIPFYVYIFQNLGIWIPLTTLEKDVLDHIVAPFTTSPMHMGLCAGLLVLV